MKTVLVTGAAGFVGSHTVEALIARGDRVVGLDNFCDYYDPARKRANLVEVAQTIGPDAPFTMHEADLREPAQLRAIFEQHTIDGVIHLAAMAGVGASTGRPQLYVDVNISGTLQMLECAAAARVDNFVFASTSSAYGNSDRVPFAETDMADRPLAPYPATKRTGELLGHAYHHVHQLNFTALRLFTIYGPRGRPDMLTYKLVDSMFDGPELPIYNRGEVSRDWTYVGDIVQGLLLALDQPRGFDVFNLGRGAPVMLKDYIDHLRRHSGREPKLRYENLPATDMAATHADLTKVRSTLGYNPRVSVEQGTLEFWRWYKRAVRGE